MPKTSPAPVKTRQKPRRAGRPAGSATAEQPVVGVALPTCPKCQGTEHRVVTKLPDQEHCGRFAGARYTRVERRRMKCESCEQLWMSVCRPFDPAAWPDEPEEIQPVD